MQERELRVRQREPDVLAARLERLDEMPGDDPARQLAADDAGDPLGRPLPADPAEEAAEPDVGADEAELAALVVELEIVHAHDLGPVGVDDLLVQEILAQAEGLGRQLARRGWDGGLAEAVLAVGPLEVGPPDDPLALGGPDDGPLDRRELLARHHSHVGEPADLDPGRIDHFRPLDLR